MKKCEIKSKRTLRILQYVENKLTCTTASNSARHVWQQCTYYDFWNTYNQLLIIAAILPQTQWWRQLWGSSPSSFCCSPSRIFVYSNTLFQAVYFLQTKIKIAVTGCYILRLKCTKIDFFWALPQTPMGELTALPKPPSWI